jgi:hypothetical protein
MPTTQPILATISIRHDAACLSNQQSAASDIMGAKVQLPKTIKFSCSDIG